MEALWAAAAHTSPHHKLEESARRMKAIDARKSEKWESVWKERGEQKLEQENVCLN